MPSLLLLLGPASPYSAALAALVVARARARGARALAPPGGRARARGADGGARARLSWAGWASSLWFATGHRMDIARLQLDTAFVGLDAFHFEAAGALLFLNTFAIPLLAQLALPMLVPRAPGAALSPPPAARATAGGAASAAAARAAADVSVGIVAERAAFERLRELALGVQLYQTLHTLGAALSAALQRRHLMVWAIFAPRLCSPRRCRPSPCSARSGVWARVAWNARRAREHARAQRRP